MVFCNKPSNVRVEQPAEEETTSWWRKIFKKRSDGRSLRKDNDDESERTLITLYKVGKKIASGGFGSVYKGKRRADGLKVAVKIVKRFDRLQYITIPNHPVPIPKEVALLILANEEPKVPEIISFIDWFEEPNRYIIVMERPPKYKAMSNFLCWCRKKEENARHILKQVIKAVLVCSERGVFHRDITFANLLINKDNKVKLIDFGAGELLRTYSYKTFIGTKPYCPPEFKMYGSYRADPATVYSLGVLLFQMVHGRFPREVDQEKSYSKGLSEECCHLIKSCLQSNPDDRPMLKEILEHPWFQESPSE